ncbi:MAG: energy-coupling factor transporter transmembrane protein EcfT [Clostridiales bacterium]|nr:energy-coupling factor transporter transmembrane protein EcfT [Clostridiales bacterium]
MKYRVGKLHPLVLFAALLTAVALASSEINPVLSPASLVFALLAAAEFGFLKKSLMLFKVTLPFFIPLIVLNALFSGNGVTVLFNFFDHSVTLEAVMYGAFSIISLTAAMIWAGCLGEMIGPDETVFLFGRISPYLALIISMIIGLIPKMLDRMEEVRILRKINGNDKEKHAVLKDITAVVFQSLEMSLETASSMRARGYGVCRPKRLAPYKMRSYDCIALSVYAVCIALLIVSKASGYYYNVYPILSAPEMTWQTWMFYFAFAGIMLLPTVNETAQKIIWNKRKPV